MADGSVDGWQLVWGAARSAEAHGAKVLTYHRVTKIERDGDRVAAVICRDEAGGEDVRINCTFVLNCAGPGPVRSRWPAPSRSRSSPAAGS